MKHIPSTTTDFDDAPGPMTQLYSFAATDGGGRMVSERGAVSPWIYSS